MSEIMIAADLHVHTVSSGHAYSTVTEIIECASQKGLQAVAITDHGPSMPGGPHRYYFGNLFVLPEEEKNVHILRGVEANIIDRDGTIDLPELYLDLLDIVWAGLHLACLYPSSRSINTEALINALENPYVDGIVHPGNPDFPIYEEELVLAARERGKLLEINNSSFVTRRGSGSRCLHIAALVKRHNGLVAVNSDAHIAGDVGNSERALLLAAEAGLDSNHIINTDFERVREFLKERGKKRFRKAI